jgi:hypothetical protein
MGWHFHVFFKFGSVRNINYSIGHQSNSCFLDNFKKLFSVLGITEDVEGLNRMPDYQTLIYLMKRINPVGIEKVIVKNLKYLVRKKVFDKYKLLDKWYMLAVDGTKIVTFKKRHCEHCLRRKIGENENGEKIYQYYHYIVNASLVTENGFCIPILTEFVENESPDVTKQDCELKAFYRLAPRLKKYFPRTQFCFLLDSLFAGKPTMDICKKYGWKYITVFKKGSIPNLYNEYQSLRSICSENKGLHIVNSKTNQEFDWVNDLDYEGHLVSVIECAETRINKKNALNTTTFVNITNIRINHSNFKNISKGGRCRWKQENEGFNCQKTGGYNLEHLFAKDYTALKNFIGLLLIGFTISTMMEKGSLIKNTQKTFGSFRNFTTKILNAFTEHSWNAWSSSLINTQYQIRLDSS